MIRKNCDNCDRLLEVPDDQAGTKVRCPDCGDMNVIPQVAPAMAVGAAEREYSEPAPGGPGSGSGPAADDRAAAAGYPPDAGPEQPVLKVRPALFRSRPVAFALVALALLGGLAGTVYFWQMAERNQWAMWPCLVLAVVMLGILVWWWIQTLSAALEVTNKRTVERRGLLSRATSEVLHDTIRNVTIKQSFWDRVWGVGEIGIASAGHDGIEIHIDRIPNPNKVREVIDLYRPL